MVDMARTAKDLAEAGMATYEPSLYPSGLAICLTHTELERLGLDANCETGDLLHMVCMAKVTSVSKRETTAGEECRVELQILDIETAENETTEYEETEEEFPRRINLDRMYTA